jgi:hypothetical protein
LYWCGTLFNYDDIYEDFIKRLNNICKKYIIGKEICPSTKKPHFQFFLRLNKKLRLEQLKLPGNPHLEPCKGDEESNIKYCSKDGDVIKFGFPKPIKIITNLYTWQIDVENIYLTEPDDRTIYWFWDAIGNTGKSSFVKYMVVKYKCLFCDGGKKADLINLVFNNDMDECRCVIWDLPRINKSCISYSALESIKNGLVCNTKYETGVKTFNPPHIFVFANFEPELENLSSDRWNIREITSDALANPTT